MTTTRALHWSFQKVCVCRVTWTDAVGSFDAVTKEWLPEKPTVHVGMVVDPACPIHGEDPWVRCPQCNAVSREPLASPELGVVCPACMRTISYGSVAPLCRGRRRILKLAERDGWICGICGKPVDPSGVGKEAPTRDHVVSKKRGGPNAFANLQLAHEACNQRKGHR